MVFLIHTELRCTVNHTSVVEFCSKNKFEKFVHLFGFIIRMYRDARSHEHWKWDISFDLCTRMLLILLSTQTTFEHNLHYSSSLWFHNFRNSKRLTGFHTVLFVQARHFLVLAASTLLATQNNWIRIHLADQSLSTQQLIATARHASKSVLSERYPYTRISYVGPHIGKILLYFKLLVPK